MFWNKKKSRFEILRDSVSERAHDALENAQDVFHHAQDALHDTLGHAPDKFSDLKGNAGGAVGALGSSLGVRVGTLKQGAQRKLEHVESVAHDRFDETRQKLLNKRHKIDKKIARGQSAMQEKKEKAVRQYVPEVVITDGGQKWLWLGIGLLIGAAIGVLLAPASGRRNRALLRDKVSKGAHQVEDLGEAAARKARDLSNRAEGVAHAVSEKVSAKIGGDSSSENGEDDVTIAERVRATLGHLPEAKMLERINVESCDGIVTLRGPIVDASTQAALVAAVQKVSGVREVKSDLLIEDNSEEAFVG